MVSFSHLDAGTTEEVWREAFDGRALPDLDADVEHLVVVDVAALFRDIRERGLARPHLLINALELGIVEEAQVDHLLAELTRVGIDVGELVARWRGLLRWGRRWLGPARG